MRDGIMGRQGCYEGVRRTGLTPHRDVFPTVEGVKVDHFNPILLCGKGPAPSGILLLLLRLILTRERV